ncbi:MAG TPA: bifunctional diaminohydroxyphosphoribosylaminopyrimidine deaminase/5-amino-6-(5-phosphoribosylamino)uracil reductase RibD [Blastocatellia bacterium]|nr:bifunctional diaminohydroxyphosphoribosylaminopyrimidine deaminase/5-amino-6-(5-phosphoribosylamino)uracil reductase RibD [Blastocatellia bacterium]
MVEKIGWIDREIKSLKPIYEISNLLVERSLELARMGIGLVSPNPLVGCVIVSERGEIVGEGTYLYNEVIHAEAKALEQAGERARGGTAYVSLEPHSHYGKTPPCTEALIKAGIRRVVAPIVDPNPLVSGKGFQHLREAGIEVVTGIRENEAAILNEKFICWHKKKRPFVHLKLAASLDGRISLNDTVSTAISGSCAGKRVQLLRHEYDAILIGGNTAVIDDPALTDRSDLKRRRPLTRIVLDNRLRIELDSKLIETARALPTLIFTNSTNQSKIEQLRSKGADVYESAMGGRDLSCVLDELRRRELQSILVEGGAEIAGSFVDAGLVDKVSFIFSPMIIGGREAPNAIGGMGAVDLKSTVRLTDIITSHHGDDIEITGYPVSGDGE